ncbi:hypothetical protein Mal15_67090 [Stieleria maiorica]|uniref:Uncharacterized protein n=1 Tax=Stieleria maiorica TaxID=2795974 RepID=A0A5B9MU53_9BACT|nr:hypothetical protein [Stieleria maiorica]QEG02588.1 hypothetical protein Mal15_67090 [Stieleria maiorica]
MRFYLPLQMRWDARSVSQALSDTGLDAQVEDDAVVIELPGVYKSRFRGLQLIQRLRGDVSRITITCRPDRVINRIEVAADQPLWWIQREPQISAALRSQGCLVVGEDLSERDIVMKYCRPSLRLLRKLCALEELDAAAWRSDVDLPTDWIGRRVELLDEIETLMVESEDFCSAPESEDEEAIVGV